MQSAFYPCSIYNAVSQGDIKKIERLLKSGVNPNVKCQTKGVIADILRYIFFPLSEKGQTPLDRAIQDMKEAYNLWGSPIISNDIITLLIESGAVIEKEKIDYYFKSTRFLIGRQGEKILTGLSGTERNQYHYGTLEDRLK